MLRVGLYDDIVGFLREPKLRDLLGGMDVDLYFGANDDVQLHVGSCADLDMVEPLYVNLKSQTSGRKRKDSNGRNVSRKKARASAEGQRLLAARKLKAETERRNHAEEATEAAMRRIQINKSIQRSQRLRQRRLERSKARMKEKEDAARDDEQSKAPLRDWLASESFKSLSKEHSRHLHGFDSFEALVAFFNTWSQELEWPRDTEGKQNTVAFSAFEGFVITLLFYRRSFSVTTLGVLLGRHPARVSEALAEWKPRLHRVGKLLASLHLVLSSEIAHSLQPKVYKDLCLDDIVFLADGSDILTEVSRSSFRVTKRQMSSKMHGAAARGLTFVLPCGAVISTTDLWLGAESEVALFSHLAPTLKWMAREDAGCADRGFGGVRVWMPLLQKIYVPSFLAGRTQFRQEEVMDSSNLSTLRYTNEVLFGRVKSWTILEDRVPIEKMRFLNSAWWFAHGMTTLQLHLREPDFEKEA